MIRFILALLLVHSTAFSQEFEPVKEVVSLGEQGADRKEILLKQEDGSIFFLNSSSDKKYDIEVEIGKRHKHCWTPNFAVSDEGHLVTKEPLKPDDFALLCLPKKGKYKVNISNENFKESIFVIVEVQA